MNLIKNIFGKKDALVKTSEAFWNWFKDNEKAFYQVVKDKIENDILKELKDFDGYLNIGRQTADSIREIYFACSGFRKPSLVLHAVQQKYAAKLDISYDIYKDKYWQSFNRFIN